MDGALRVVRPDLRAEAVPQRRDDAAPVGVVLWVRAGDQEDVQLQAHAVAADLDVALLHDVEEADLDALGKVGQLVDAEDAAVRPRDQAVVDRQLVAEIAALGDLDRIDLADEVGDSIVRRRELLTVALVARHPGDLDLVDLVVDLVAAGPADWSVGIVPDLAVADVWHLLVEEVDERPDDARLGLAALTQEDDVLSGEDGVLQLRDDRILIAEDPRQDVLLLLDPLDQVAPHLLFDGRHLIPGIAQVTDRLRFCLCHVRPNPLPRAGGLFCLRPMKTA